MDEQEINEYAARLEWEGLPAEERARREAEIVSLETQAAEDRRRKEAEQFPF